MVWIPEMARKRPERALALRYQIAKDAPPLDAENTVRTIVHASGLTVAGSAADGWRLSLPGRTRVYGVISREVDEGVDLRLSRAAVGWELRVHCQALETHAAHAAGLGTFGLCDGLITPIGKAIRVGSVVAKMNFTCAGGSSSVFNSALNALVESM